MADEIVSSLEFPEEINFIEVNAETIEKNSLDYFEEYTKEKLYPGDDRRMFAQGIIYLLAVVQNYINETGRGNMLAYAEGGQLDSIGQLFKNSRLAATHAKTTMQITLAAAQDKDVVIPAGTRVTNDGTYIFVLDEAVVFPAKTEELVQEVGATAIEPGEAYNDLVPGQINKIVDSKYGAYVAKVENIEKTDFGTDTEDDESYRERLQIAPFTFSVAGPSEAYRAVAMGVSNTIQDANPYSPSAGVVEIPIVLVGGVLPEADDEILTEVYNACSEKSVRPLTDKVQVVPAVGVETNINVKYYVKNNDMSVVADIMAAVEAYKEWQTGKIKRDIVPDELLGLMREAGAARVEITEPVYQALAENEVAQIIDTNVTFGGSINV